VELASPGERIKPTVRMLMRANWPGLDLLEKRGPGGDGDIRER